MCPGMRPATGWMAKRTSTPALARAARTARAGGAGPGPPPCRSRARPPPGAPARGSGQRPRGSRSSPPGPRPALAACTCPKAPKSTLVKERFMARHMMMERIRPEDPSSAPAVTSSLLSRTKPMATAARPAYELRRADDGGHVRAADGNDEQHAEGEGEDDDHGQEVRQLRRSPDQEQPARDREPQQAQVDRVLEGVGHGTLRDELHLLQLRPRP